MLNNKPLVKLFKTSDKYYMYDTNKNTILNITKNQYTFLKNCMENNIDDYVQSKETKKLYEEGFLSSNRVKEIVHPSDDLLNFYLENNIKMLTLQVTQQCNFRCEYCIYSGSYLNRSHSSKKMSIETAFKGIDFLINHSNNHDEVNVSFYGGEPLLEFDFVKQCIEYAEKKADCKKIKFSMTTNASLLNDEIIEYLYKHDVALTISLDGPKEVHDKHRKLALNNKGSFDKVINNIINIEKKFPEYTKRILFNAVIDIENDFSCIDKFFLDYDTVKNITMRSSLITDNYSKSNRKINEDYTVKVEYEVFKILYSMIRKKNTKNCSRIAIQEYDSLMELSQYLVPQKMLPERDHPAGPCVPGAQRLFMNAEGFFYPCERVSESSEIMKIGHIDKGFDINKARKILNVGKANQEKCKNCWAIRFCGICGALVDNAEKEFSKKKIESHCKKVKVGLEEKFKNYCTLKEFNHNFEENQERVTFSE